MKRIENKYFTSYLNVEIKRNHMKSCLKVKKILKGRRDSIPSPSRSHEHLNFLFEFFRQIIAGLCHQTF